MHKQPRIIIVALFLILSTVWIGGCDFAGSKGQRADQPAIETPTTPPQETSAGQPTEAAAVVSEAPDTGTPVDALAAELDGLELDDFFEVSWRGLSLRDPEAVLADGLAQDYGLADAQLTDISDGYIRETQAMVATILHMLRTYERDELTPEQQVSYDVYEWYLDDRVRQHQFMYHDYPANFFVTGVHEQLTHFFTDLHPLSSKQEAEDYIARLKQVDTKFEQLLEGLRLREEAGIVPPRFAVEWTLYGVRGTASSTPTATRFYTAFAEKVGTQDDVSDAERRALLKSAEQAIQESVLPAFQALAEYLQHLESVAPTDDGVWQFPNGDAYYTYLLRHYTTTDLTAGEIHELGRQELKRIHAEMRAISDQLGYPQDEALSELFDRVAEDGGHVSGNDVFATYETLVAEADGNLGEAFDIRPQAGVIVVQSPIKGMYVPAALDGSRPGAFHAGPGNTTEERYAMPTLAYHEAVPGHHFQIALAQESDLPSFRNSMSFTGYAEGWALYAEQLASELGWYEDDPHGNLGRLQAEAFRAARLVVDTGIHAKGWTFDQALDYFAESTGYESDDSVPPRFQIARYIVWPGQATAYKIGMIKMLELRQRAMDRLGDRFDLKEFHRVVLENGSMPLEVLERVVDDYIEASMLAPAPAAATAEVAGNITSPSTPASGSSGLRISIVYDNTAYDERLEANWGFAAVLEYGGHTLLFDTGGDGPTLLNNMEKMGLDPQAIEFVVLSHIHGDHTDGLAGLLNTGVQPTVYVPASFPRGFKESVRARTKLAEVTEPLEILPGVHSTGELAASVREQGLVVETPEGIVVITGCAHPGIVRMVRAARDIVADEIVLVIGGFHLGNTPKSRVSGIIADFRDLGVKQVTPSHCTGEEAISMFTDEYGDAYLQGGAGRVITVGTAP